MQVTATEFRKHLFQVFERVLRGEHIEVLHKGRRVRLVPAEGPSKLSRLVRRDTLACHPDELDKHLAELDKDMRVEGSRKWQNRL